MQNGQATEQCHQNIRFDFIMGDQSGASRKFIREYKIARALLDNNELEEAAKEIAELHEFEHPNRYENSWIWNIDSILAKKLGQQKRELRVSIGQSQVVQGKAKNIEHLMIVISFIFTSENSNWKLSLRSLRMHLVRSKKLKNLLQVKSYKKVYRGMSIQ